MELRHLRYFCAVAEELNFRRAAERLHVTQPSLSAQVRKLEEELEVRLLDRDTHHVALTPAGRYFHREAGQILLSAQTAARNARRVDRGELGALSIGFVGSLGHGLMPSVLRAYRKKFPRIELKLTEMDTAQQVEALGARRLDLGFIGLGLPAETSDLQLATVAEETLHVALPLGHALLKGKKVATLPLARLAGEKFLLAARESAPLFNPWLLVLCQQAGFQPEILQETGQPVTVLNYVAAGLGVTILPAQFARLPTVGVRFVPLAKPVPPYRYCAAWSPRNTHAALSQFVAIARETGGC